MLEKKYNRKFKAGMSLVVVAVLLISGISIVSGISINKNTSQISGDENIIDSNNGILSDKQVDLGSDDVTTISGSTVLNNDNVFSGGSPLVPHPIYGTATWEGGGDAVGASVAVTSSLGTLTTTVGSGGAWQVDCGDPGPNWPSGTSFNVYVNGTGDHSGWYGSATGTVSGNYNNMGNIVVYDNDPPNTPSTPSGPTSGQSGQSYTYSTSATDPESNNVYYWFDWDDSTNSGWVGPYTSGQTGSASHSWSSDGTYDIKAKAKDIHNEESGWSPTLTVTITTNNPPNTPSNPSPANGATGVDVNADLSWTGGDPDSGDTVTYDVYFEAGDSTPDVLVSNDQSGTTYDPGTMDYNTHYYWKIIATDNHGASTNGPVWNFVTTTLPNDPPNIPSTPTGPNSLMVGEYGTYSTKATDPDGDKVQYKFDWGDGTQSDWTSLVPSGTTGSKDYSWSSAGSYLVKAMARDEHGATSSWSGGLTVVVNSNRPPNTPVVSGETNGVAGIKYIYSAVSSDPDGDQISYYWDWDDGSFSGWLGPYNSGVSCEASHAWWKEKFVIKVKAKDVNGLESDWGTLEVTMPKSKIANNFLFQSMLQTHPNLFLVLQKLLIRFGLQ